MPSDNDHPDDTDTIRLERWDGTCSPDDPNANFKAEVALYSLLDPLATIQSLSENVGVPVGAIVRYVLAKYATSGSGGLLELGPSMVHRLWAPIARAEASGDDEARLAAYRELSSLVSWLRVPLMGDGGYRTA